MSHFVNRLRDRLVTVKFPQDQADAANGQIRDIVAYHVATFDVHKDIDEQMAAVAFDCYVQGLVDGAQVAPLNDIHGEG